MNSNFLKESNLDGITVWTIEHPLFTAKIANYGAHVLSFVPKGKADLLWLSKDSMLDGSKAIRGGIPLCWPWFGPAANENLGGPQHGYARTHCWKIVELKETAEFVEMVLAPEFPDALASELRFDLVINLKFSEQLTVSMTSTNTSEEAAELSQAIHTYFAIDDIRTTKLVGLESCEYIDKLTSKTEVQDDRVVLSAHTDRVYLTSQPDFKIENGQRTIHINGQQHDSVVVWNPWQEGAKAMADFHDEGYLNMICVEMANTQGLILQAGESYTMSQSFS